MVHPHRCFRILQAYEELTKPPTLSCLWNHQVLVVAGLLLRWLLLLFGLEAASDHIFSAAESAAVYILQTANIQMFSGMISNCTRCNIVNLFELIWTLSSALPAICHFSFFVLWFEVEILKYNVKATLSSSIKHPDIQNHNISGSHALNNKILFFNEIILPSPITVLLQNGFVLLAFLRHWSASVGPSCSSFHITFRLHLLRWVLAWS